MLMRLEFSPNIIATALAAALLFSVALFSVTGAPTPAMAKTGIEAKLQNLLPEDPQKREATVNKLRTRINELLPKAQSGDAEAQFELATWLLVLGERESAIQWYRAAATLGHEKAQSTLAALSSQGIGEENKLVYEWARQEAGKGNPEAQYRLGDMLVWGRGGLQRDMAQAAEWLKKAADQGHTQAAFQLGMIHLGGQIDGAPAPETALPLIRQAADAGHNDARRKLAQLYLQGTGVTQDLAKSLELFLLAGENGDIGSLYDAAVMIDNGQGITADPARAEEFYLRAAEAGHIPSQMALANLYLSGDGIQKNEEAAAEWMARAAQNGSTQAMLLLSRLYDEGIGVKASKAQANKWLKQSAEAGLPDAQYTLSRKFLAGDGFPATPGLAAAWAIRAAMLGHEDALNDAAYYLFHGAGVAQDFERAYTFGSQALRSQSGAIYPDTLFIMGVLEQIGGEDRAPNPTAARDYFATAAEAGHPMAHLSLAYMAHKGEATGAPNPSLAFEHAMIAAMLLPEESEPERKKALNIISQTSGQMDQTGIQSAKDKANAWLARYEAQN